MIRRRRERGRVGMDVIEDVACEMNGVRKEMEYSRNTRECGSMMRRGVCRRVAQGTRLFGFGGRTEDRSRVKRGLLPLSFVACRRDRKLAKVVCPTGGGYADSGARHECRESRYSMEGISDSRGGETRRVLVCQSRMCGG